MAAFYSVNEEKKPAANVFITTTILVRPEETFPRTSDAQVMADTGCTRTASYVRVERSSPNMVCERLLPQLAVPVK
jgi:hypothetical protein